MESRFNLVDEPWIPVAASGLASLRDIFRNPNYREISGNPVQKIALTKLLLAIAQAANTPANEHAWRDLGTEGLAESCLAYLDRWHDRFYLYGDQPFLQMPAIAEIPSQRFGSFIPEVATGNSTVLFQSQVEHPLDNQQKAVLLVTLMGFGMAGGSSKHNALVLTPGYTGKDNGKGRPSLNRPGPLVGYNGFLHSFLIGSSLHKTLWINLFSMEQIDGDRLYSHGVGVAPWEKMPSGEDCETARKLKRSLIGVLVPMNRFCLLADDGIRCTEGILHPLEGNPSVAIKPDGKSLLANPTIHPWRHFASLLSGEYPCQQIRNALAHDTKDPISIWSGGLKISYSSGQNFLSGSDGYAESKVRLSRNLLGTQGQQDLHSHIELLEGLGRILYSSVRAFFLELKASNPENHAKRAQEMYWELCARNTQNLFDVCALSGPDGSEIHTRKVGLRKLFADLIWQIYDVECHAGSARMLEVWAKCRPNALPILKKLFDEKTEEPCD